MYRRRWIAPAYREDAALWHLLEDPDAAMAAAGAQVMKDDHAATVARVAGGGGRFVIKRYRPNQWHKWVSRALRPSKAARSRRAAMLLRAAGVPAAEPVALVEDWVGFVRIRAWLVSRTVEGATLSRLLRGNSTDRLGQRQLIAQLIDEIACAHGAGVTFGDTKPANFVVNGGRLVCVDLDAVSRPWPQWRLRHAQITDWRVLIETLKAGAEVEAMVLEELERRLSADEMRLLKRRLD